MERGKPDDRAILIKPRPQRSRLGSPQPVVAKISQETLAEMIGTTRSRVSSFMNKFRRMGFIEYNGHLEVHSSLLSVALHDDSRSVSGSDVSSFELVGG